MATQGDILEPVCETTKEEGGKTKDQATNISLNKLPKEEKTQADQLHELPETLESNFDVKHLKKGNESSEQTFEGEQILGSPSIAKVSSEAHNIPLEEIVKVNCNTETDPQIVLSDRTEERTSDAVEPKAKSLECVSKIVSDKETEEAPAVKAPLSNDSDATLAVIHEPKIENEDLRKSESSEDIKCTGNTLVEIEAEAQKSVEPLQEAPEDINVSASSQNKKTTISLEQRNLIADSQEILDDKIVDKTADAVKAETLEVQNVVAIVSNEEAENNFLIQVDEHYQKKSEKPSLLENAECTLLEGEPSESLHVASEDIKAFTLSQANETKNYFEDQALNANPVEILDDKAEEKPSDEADIKEETLQVQSLATISSNEDIEESEKAPLIEHAKGLTNADIAETLHGAEIADEKTSEDELFHSEKNVESSLLKKEAEGVVDASASGQDIDAACSFEDESLTANPQEKLGGKAEERTADGTYKKEETLDILNASTTASKESEEESLIGMDDSQMKHEEHSVKEGEEPPVRKAPIDDAVDADPAVIHEAEIENAELGKSQLSENPLPKVEAQTEKCAESMQIALENPITSADTTIYVEEKSIIADSRGILDDKIQDRTMNEFETMEQNTEDIATFVSNDESNENLLIQVGGSQLKNEEHLERETEKLCLMEISTRDIDPNKQNLEVGDEDINRAVLFVNEGNTECNLVKEEAEKEKVVKSSHVDREEYKILGQVKEVAKEEAEEEKPVESLLAAPQDNKVLNPETEVAEKVIEEETLIQALHVAPNDDKVLSQVEKDKTEAVKLVESLHVAHEDDKSLSLDMEAEKEEGEKDKVADSLNAAEDGKALCQDTKVAVEENLVESLHVADVADKALSPDLEVAKEVTCEENFLLVDPENGKSLSQDKEIEKEKKPAESSYVELEEDKLEAEHEKQVESSDVELEHDKAFIHKTEVTKKEVDVEHVAESLNEAVDDKALSQDTEATKEEIEEKNEESVGAAPENNAILCQEVKINDEEKLEEFLYIAHDADKALCQDTEIAKKEATEEKPLESLHVVFEDDGNKKIKVAEDEQEEEKPEESFHVAHEDAKALSQDAEVSIKEIEEMKPVESLNVPPKDDNEVSQDTKTAKMEVEEKSVESLHANDKALSQDSLTKEDHNKTLGSHEATTDQGKEENDEGLEDSDKTVKDKVMNLHLTDNQHVTPYSEPLCEDTKVAMEEIEEVEPVESLHVPFEDEKELCLDNQVEKEEAIEDKLVESIHVSPENENASNQDTVIAKEEGEKFVEPSCIALEDDKEITNDIPTKQPHSSTLGSDEAAEDQSKETNDEVQKDLESIVKDKDIDLEMTDNLQHVTPYSEPLSQDREAAIEEVEEEKPITSLHVLSEDDKGLCLDNQVAKEAAKDKLVESFPVASEDENASNQDTKVAKEGENSVESSCIALEDDKEISTNISTEEPHNNTLGSHEAEEDQRKETTNEVQKDLETVIDDKVIALQMTDNLLSQDREVVMEHVISYSEPLSQNREVVIEEIEGLKNVESLCVLSKNDKELCLDNQIAKEEEAEDQRSESFLVAPVDEKVSYQDTKVAKEEGEKSTELLCVALEDDKEISADTSTKEPHSSTLGSYDAVEDQIKETKDEVKKDPEIIFEDKDIDQQMTDNLHDVTPDSEPLSQDREVAIEEVKEVKPLESLHVPSEDDKTLCLDNQVAAAEEEVEDKLVESFHVAPAPVDKKTSNQDIEVAKEEGEKFTESSGVAPLDDKEISTDSTAKEPHNNIFGSHEAPEDQSKKINDEVQKDPESIVKSKDINLEMTDNPQHVKPYSEPLNRDRDAAIEDVEEVKPIISLHVPSEDDKESCADNQVAKEAEDKLVESFLVAPEDENASNQDKEVAKQGEKFVESSCVALEDDKEIGTDISTKESHNKTLGSHEAAENQSKEANDEVNKDCKTIVEDKDNDLQMMDNLQNVMPCSEPLSQDREVAMEEVEEMKPVDSLHVPSEDDKILCPDSLVAEEEEVEDKPVESFHVAPQEKRTSNQDTEVAKEGEKFVESSCVALEDGKEISTNISIKEPHDTLVSHEAAEDQSKELNDEVKKDPEPIVKDKDIDLELTDKLQHATPCSEPLTQDREAAIKEVEEVKPVASLHVPSEDDKELCLDSQVAKEEVEEVKPVASLHVPSEDEKELWLDSQVAKEEVEDKLVESFLVAPEYENASNQVTEVAECGDKFVESSCVALEDDKEISRNISTNEPHNNTLGSHDAAKDQSKETNDEVQKDPETIVKDKDIELQMTDNLQLAPFSESLSQDREVVMEEIEPVESLHVPSEDKELCTDNQEAKEEEGEDKLAESFDLAIADVKASNQDTKVATEEGEESEEFSCVALDGGKQRSQDISTKEPHNSTLVSHEAAEDQSKEINDKVQDDPDTMVMDKEIDLQVIDNQHVTPCSEAQSQDAEVLMEEIEDSKPIECLPALSEDDKELILDMDVVKEQAAEEKLVESFHVAPEDDKASCQETKAVSEEGEEEKLVESSHVALEDGRELSQDTSMKEHQSNTLGSDEAVKDQSIETNDEVQKDNEMTVKDKDIDLQMTDNQHVEAQAFREAMELKQKSSDENIVKARVEEKNEEKPIFEIPIQEAISAENDEKNFLVSSAEQVKEGGPCEDEKIRTEPDAEVPGKIENADSKVKTTEMVEEGYLQDLQTTFAVAIATHEEKGMDMENVKRQETETSDASEEVVVINAEEPNHEQEESSIVEVSEEEPQMSHEKIEEPQITHEKSADVTSLVHEASKERTDHISVGEIICNEETESKKTELFGDESSTTATNENLVEVDSHNGERELEISQNPVEGASQKETEVVKLISASLEEEKISHDFSKEITDDPESIPNDLKANEGEQEKTKCIQEIVTIDEIKEEATESKTEEIANDFLQKSSNEPAQVEDHPTAEKELSTDGEELTIEKTTACVNEAGEQKISVGSSETPIMIETRGKDLATLANEALDENFACEVAGNEKTSHEIIDITESTATKNDASLRGYLINDKSIVECETKSSDEIPEITEMTSTPTEGQVVESPCVEEASAYELQSARAKPEVANIRSLASPKFGKITGESAKKENGGANETSLELSEEEISKAEDNLNYTAREENVEDISETKEILEPNSLEKIPEPLTQVQNCNVISKPEETEMEEEEFEAAPMEIKSEMIASEGTFEPETAYEVKKTELANMSREKIKEEDEDRENYPDGSCKEEIIREIQTENEVDRDIEEVCEVIETAKGNEEVSKVLEDTNVTQNISKHVAYNDKAVEELDENLQSNESIDGSLNQIVQGKNVEEVPTLLDTEEAVHDLESTCAKSESPIEKAESSDIKFEDNKSTAVDIDNEMIKEPKLCAVDAAKAELPGKPNECTVSERATKPPHKTLEHCEDNRGYSNPIMMPQPEDSVSKHLVPEFSQEKESEKWDNKKEIPSSDKVKLEDEDIVMLSAEKSEEKASITDNWSIITGDDNGKTCIEADILDFSTDKQVVLQPDHIESILAPEKKNSTESSLVEGGDLETFKVDKEDANCGNEEQARNEATKSMEEPEKVDVHKPSLEDLHQVSTKAINPMADHCSTGEETAVNKEELHEEKSHKDKHEEARIDEEHDEEELCGQHKSDSSSEAPVMVDERDADMKHAHKKSHNILSGVGSKVKHSIAKVKKAITGKTSHPKPPSPK